MGSLYTENASLLFSQRILTTRNEKKKNCYVHVQKLIQYADVFRSYILQTQTFSIDHKSIIQLFKMTKKTTKK